MGRAAGAAKAVIHTLFVTPPFSFMVAGLAYLVGVLVFQFLPQVDIKYLNSEAGPFEQGSVALWLASVLIALASWQATRALSWLAGAVVLLYAALRELDFQTLFTYRSVMSLGFFTGSRATGMEKIVVFALMLPCLIAILYLIRRAYSFYRKRAECLHEFGHVASMALWIVILFLWCHLHDRGSYEWIRFGGHIEALNEAALAMLVLMLIVEMKPRLIRAA